MARRKSITQLLKEDEVKYHKIKKVLPRTVGTVAVNFYQDNFQRQGFKNSIGVKKWKKRKKVDAGRAILVKTGKLKRSIRRLRTGKNVVVVGIRANTKVAKYAAVHNFGLRSGRPSPGSFTMPKNQFIGKSKSLDKKILKLMTQQINRAFK